MKILCTADVHIGRRPSRLPAHVDCRPLSCGECWTRVVEHALEERVDLVAVGGDLVDRDNRFYEAVGPLELGLRRLAHAGITTVLVAGNHDHQVLPWLVEGQDPDRVRLLGRGGRWERFTLERGGRVLHVDGWSFPDSHVRRSPLESYPAAASDAPVLGLLHADLDQPRSAYAPVGLAELRALGPAFWLLGHVHAARLLEEPGSATVLYPGSPQAMDPGESGSHGAWVVELGADRRFSCRSVPLSSVRYEEVEVEVEGVGEETELDRRVADAVRARLVAAAGEGSALRYLCCRLRLVGRTPLHRRLEERLRALAPDLAPVHEGVMAVVEEVVVETRPERDLEALARGSDAPAVLARLLQGLERGTLSAEQERLVREATRYAQEIRAARPYLGLPGQEPRVPQELRRQALLLIDELLAQAEAAG